MKFWEAIVLGLVQGIAEFLPISSSGHLSILQNLFHMQTAEDGHLLFDVLLHLGTLVSVCVFYRKDIAEMLRAVLSVFAPKPKPDASGGGNSDLSSRQAGRLLLMAIVATAPLIVILPVKDQIERLYYSTGFIGITLILTGFMLFVSDKMKPGDKTEKNMTILDSIVIGICQAIAVIPGLSRSGTTITAGLATGLDREFAVKFSFIISLPAVLGANLLSIFDAVKEGVDWSLVPIYLIGMTVAGISGFAAISLVKVIAKSGKFGLFAYYCWVVGAVTVVLSIMV